LSDQDKAMKMNAPSEKSESTEASHSWVSRADAVAVFVLAVIFLAWVASIFVRQRLAGKDVQVLPTGEAAARYLVDLNRADAVELMLLPGIGEVRANRIVDWRTEHGPFQTLDEVGKATGLSAKGAEKLREFVILGEAERFAPQPVAE